MRQGKAKDMTYSNKNLTNADKIGHTKNSAP